MPPRSDPPAWLARTTIALLFAAVTGWAAFVTQKSMAVDQQKIIYDHKLELVNYKLDVLLRAHGFDPNVLPIELKK